MCADSVPGDIVFNHGAFVHYLSGTDMPKPQDPTRQNKSLEKLAGFSETYFIELSADMFDELQRRMDPELFAKGPLKPFQHIHWKRNDARRQVGTLPEYRFREICRDIVTEQERRYPQLKTGATYPLRDSMPMDALRKSQQRALRRTSQAHSLVSIHESTPSSHTSDNSSRGALRMQNVSQTKVNPKTTDIVESDSDTDMENDISEQDLSESFDLNSQMPKNDPSVLRGDHLPFTPVHSQGTFDNLADGDAKNELRDSVLDDASVWSQSPPASPKLDPENEKEANNSGLGISIDSESKDQDQNQNQNQNQDQDADLSNNTVIVNEDANIEGASGSKDEDAELESTNDLTNKNALPALENAAEPGNTADQTTDQTSEKAVTPAQVPSADNSEHLARIAALEAAAAKRDEEYRSLQARMEEQKKITDQVREEAAKSLQEMKAMAAKNQEHLTRAESWETEIEHWKQLYKTVMQELSRTRNQFLSSEVKQAELDKHLPTEFINENGAVDEKDLYDCLKSIHNLVAYVHSKNAGEGDILTMLHQVILTSRKIYIKGDEDKVIPTAANQLIGIVKNYSISLGLLPTILVDSACSDLGHAVVEYARRKGVKPNAERDSAISVTPRVSDISFMDSEAESSPEKRNITNLSFESGSTVNLPNSSSSQANLTLSQDRPMPALTPPVPPVPVANEQSKASADVANASVDSLAESTLNNATPNTSTANLSLNDEYTPRQRQRGLYRPKQGPQLPLDLSIQALQQFLEDQTSDTVDAISGLLTGIKKNATAGELKPKVNTILVHVQHMIEATVKAMSETRNQILRERGKYIVDNLRNCLERLEMLLDEELEAVHNDAKPNRHLKQRLAGVNFDMAKSTKELVKAVEEILLQEEVGVIDSTLE